MNKIVIGSDKGSYSLSGREITISNLDFTPTQEQLAYLYNITQDKFYYAPAENISRATVNGLVITIDSFYPEFDVGDKVHIQMFDPSYDQNIIVVDATGNEVTLEPNGSLPVTLQDQTTPIIIM